MMTRYLQVKSSFVMKSWKNLKNNCVKHIPKRLNNGECTAQAGINYVDYLSHYTRIADHAINLVEKVTEGVI